MQRNPIRFVVKLKMSAYVCKCKITAHAVAEQFIKKNNNAYAGSTLWRTHIIMFEISISFTCLRLFIFPNFWHFVTIFIHMCKLNTVILIVTNY